MSGYGVPEVSSHALNRVEKHGDETDGDKELSVSYFEQSLKFDMKPGKYYYGVQIVTGKQLFAGTKIPTYITLVGDRGQTEVSLQDFWACLKPTDGRETFENIVVETEMDLGNVLVVIIGCRESLIEDLWYVCSVGVVNMQSKDVLHFPCYHWIGRNSSVSITANTTTKKDVDGNEVLLNQRAFQLKQQQEMYRWQKFPSNGIPSGIDDSTGNLPPDERFDAVKNIDFTTGALAGFGTLITSSLFITADDLHAYEKLADVLGGKKPLYQAGRWTSDVEFGRQMLNGVNPIVIKKCTKLPLHFPVTNDMVQPFLVRGLTLEQEMEAGHVYICDMKIFEGLPPREGCFSVAPVCLLYVNNSGQLIPIAIQLQQGVKEEDNPIFLPSDNWIDWLIAKMYYQNAHSQFHEIFSHYISCHATMEAYAMGTQRNLPDPHPIFKLLRPHFRYTMAINSRARATLINKGGILDLFFGIGGEGLTKLFELCGTSYNVHTSSVKAYAKQRGVDNPEELPGYYYRDDGIKVWDALEEYASEIINEFYQSDDDVQQDEELQAWAYDIHTNGFPGYHGASEGHGFPKKIATKEDLKYYCTLIMFTGSAQHASVNFEQYYYYRFVPNAPFSVCRPPPNQKGEADFQYFLDSLPDEISTIGSIGATHLLSQYSQNEEFLGDFKARFREKRATRIVEKLKKNLSGISGDIYERNKDLDMPYTGMEPNKIPNSITI